MASLDSSPPSWPPLRESDGSLHFHEDSTNSSHFVSRMHDLWTGQRFCDVTLVVGDQQFPAHRLVLASHSPYFEKMFKSPLMEGSQSTIRLHETQPEYFKLLLEFMYSGRLAITDGNVKELLVFANFLGLESVCQICGDYLVRKLAPENAIRTLELANANNQHKLMTQVSRYAAKHIVLISEYKDFVEMSVDLLECVLQHHDFLATRGKYGNFLLPWDMENMLADVLLKYITHDIDNRLSLIPRVFSVVRMGSFSYDMLIKLKNKISSIGASGQLMDIFENPPRRIETRKGGEYFLRSGPGYGFMSQDLAKSCIIRDDKCPVRGMDFYSCNIFNPAEGNDTNVLAGLKVHFFDGHVNTMGNVESLSHQSFFVRDGEKIVAVQVMAGLLVHQLVFWTSHNRVLGPFVGTGGHQYEKEAHIRGNCYGYLGGLSCLEVDIQREQRALCNLSFKWLISKRRNSLLDYLLEIPAEPSEH